MLALALAALSACSTKAIPPPGALKVERVDIRGAERVDDEAVEKAIGTTETQRILGGVLEGVPLLGVFDALTVEYHTFDRLVLERDLERVRRFYQARGFYAAEVRAGRVVRTEQGQVRVEIEVFEGLPVRLVAADYRLEDVNEEASESQSPQEARALFAVNKSLYEVVAGYERAEGETAPIFDEDEYDEVKRKLVRTLTDAGYAYAEVKGTVEVDIAGRAATVAFTARAGPASVFGPIRIEGLGEIPEQQVLDAIDIEPGEPYSSTKLEKAQYHLADLGVFGSVELRPEKSAPGEPLQTTIPVNVRLAPIKLRGVKGGVGAEAGSRVAGHGVAGWEDRNFLGGLRKLSVEARPALVLFPTTVNTIFTEPPTRVLPEVGARIDFEQPAFPEKRTTMLLSTGARIYVPQSTISTFDDLSDQDEIGERQQRGAANPSVDDFFIVGYRELDGSLGFERKWPMSPLGGFTLYAAQFAKVQFDDPFSYNRASIPEGYSRVLIPYLETVLAWDLRKDAEGKPEPLTPHHGLYLGTNLQVGAEFIGGDAGDVRLRPELRAYAPLYEDVIIAFRWTTGFLFPRNYGDSFEGELDAMPAREQQLLSFRGFYSGGPTSNRGYNFRQVGPHAQLDFLIGQGSQNRLPVGGVGMWELSSEVRFPITGDFLGVVFVDASDVVLAFDRFRFTHPHISPGLGARYASPVGRIRVDLGVRPPYLQRIGKSRLEPEEGGPEADEGLGVPIAFHLAIGEAF